MKKLFAILLSLILLSISATSLAADCNELDPLCDLPDILVQQ
jgi:hypothetical protein